MVVQCIEKGHAAQSTFQKNRACCNLDVYQLLCCMLQCMWPKPKECKPSHQNFLLNEFPSGQGTTTATAQAHVPKVLASRHGCAEADHISTHAKASENSTQKIGRSKMPKLVAIHAICEKGELCLHSGKYT